MTIKSIDRATCRIIRERIDSKLEELSVELGMKFKAGNAKFGGSHIDFTLEASLINKLAPDETSAGRAFKSCAHMFNLEPTDLGRTFGLDDKVYRITGLSRNRPKYPIDGECVRTGKGFKFPATTVVRALMSSKPPAPVAPEITASGYRGPDKSSATW